jgi:hypothetical protein
MRALPDSHELFVRFFDPWYDDAGRQRRGFRATFPDVIQHGSFVGLSQAEASCGTEEGRHEVVQAELMARLEGTSNPLQRTGVPTSVSGSPTLLEAAPAAELGFRGPPR